MILSPKIRACMEIPFKWGQRFGTLPFEWNEEEKVVTLTRSKTRMCVWVLWNIYLAGLGTFLSYRLLQKWDSDEMKENLTIRYISLLVVNGSYAFLQYQICLALVYKSIPQTFNSVTDYVVFFQVKYRRFGNRKTPCLKQGGRDLGDILFINYYLLFLTHAPLWIYLVKTPEHIFHVSPSRILGYTGIPIPYMAGVTVDSFLATAIIAAVSELIISTQILFWVFSVLPLQFALTSVASRFGMEEENIWTRAVLQLPGPFMSVSKQLALLSAMIMEIAEPMMLVVPVNFIIAMTMAAYCAIKETYSLQKLAAGVSFLQLLALFIVVNRVAGKFPEVYERNLTYYLKQRRGKLTEKSLRSLAIPRMMVYGLFAPGNELIITGLQAVFDNIISCLAVNAGKI